MDVGGGGSRNLVNVNRGRTCVSVEGGGGGGGGRRPLWRRGERLADHRETPQPRTDTGPGTGHAHRLALFEMHLQPL